MFIRASYRIRGSLPRVQINIMDIAVLFSSSSVLDILLVSIVIVISLIKRIFIYSAIKISANIELLYSILNPETSSDSPSAKSNGVQCVSARIEIIQDRVRGINIILVQEYVSRIIISVFIVVGCSRKQIRIKDMLTS